MAVDRAFSLMPAQLEGLRKNRQTEQLHVSLMVTYVWVCCANPRCSLQGTNCRHELQRTNALLKMRQHAYSPTAPIIPAERGAVVYEQALSPSVLLVTMTLGGPSTRSEFNAPLAPSFTWNVSAGGMLTVR